MTARKKEEELKLTLDPDLVVSYHFKLVKLLEGNHIHNTIEQLTLMEEQTKSTIILWLLALGIESMEKDLHKKYGKVPDLHLFVKRMVEGFKNAYPMYKMPIKRKRLDIKKRLAKLFTERPVRGAVVRFNPYLFGYKGVLDEDNMKFIEFWMTSSKDDSWQSFGLDVWEKAYNRWKKAGSPE